MRPLRSIALAAGAVMLTFSAFAQGASDVPRNETLIVENPEGTIKNAGWFNYWARERIERDGAIFHVFERLGRRRFKGLDRELRDIMKEKGARDEDPFDEVVAHAPVIDLRDTIDLSDLIARLHDEVESTREGPVNFTSILRASCLIFIENCDHGRMTSAAA